MSEHTAEKDAGCRLGYTEHDGARYCHEHGGFLEPGVQSLRCDLAPCLRCGFDPKRFEPRPEKQRGAARWHLALHESGRVLPPGKGEGP
jgi:hypothetical protein